MGASTDAEADAALPDGCGVIVQDDFSAGTAGPWTHAQSGSDLSVDFSGGRVTLGASGLNAYSVLSSPKFAEVDASTLPTYVKIDLTVLLDQSKGGRPFTLAQVVGYFPFNVQLVTRGGVDGGPQTLSLRYDSTPAVESSTLPQQLDTPQNVGVLIMLVPGKGLAVELTVGGVTTTLPEALSARMDPKDAYFQMGPFNNLGNGGASTVVYDDVLAVRCP